MSQREGLQRQLERVELGLRRLARGWTQGHNAMNYGGQPTPPSGPDACRWCLNGATFAPEGSTDPYNGADAVHAHITSRLQTRVRAVGYQFVSAWNDRPERTAAEVAEMLRQVRVEIIEELAALPVADSGGGHE